MAPKSFRTQIDRGNRVLLLGLAVADCRAGEGTRQRPTSPMTVSPAEFKSLRWLEGRWKGKAPDGKPFYEAYRFTDDSTIATWNYPDSTALVATDSGEIRLRGGQATSGGEQVAWVVAALDSGTVEFAPLRSARNSFTWAREPGGGWVATLHWPASGNEPAREVVYHMGPSSAPAVPAH